MSLIRHLKILSIEEILITHSKILYEKFSDFINENLLENLNSEEESLKQESSSFILKWITSILLTRFWVKGFGKINIKPRSAGNSPTSLISANQSKWSYSTWNEIFIIGIN